MLGAIILLRKIRNTVKVATARRIEQDTIDITELKSGSAQLGIRIIRQSNGLTCGCRAHQLRRESDRKRSQRNGLVAGSRSVQSQTEISAISPGARFRGNHIAPTTGSSRGTIYVVQDVSGFGGIEGNRSWRIQRSRSLADLPDRVSVCSKDLQKNIVAADRTVH